MAAQAAQGRSFGRSLLSVIGAGGIIISAFTDWLDGRNAWDMPISSLYHQTFQNAPTFGLATARWSYRLLPDGAGTLLVEEFTDHRGPAMKVIGSLGHGVVDVVTYNRDKVDLKRLQQLAEKVYAGGAREIAKLVDDIWNDRRIQV